MNYSGLLGEHHTSYRGYKDMRITIDAEEDNILYCTLSHDTWTYELKYFLESNSMTARSKHIGGVWQPDGNWDLEFRAIVEKFFNNLLVDNAFREEIFGD